VETRRIGGLGIHFIRKSMQNFQYSRLGNRNLLLFTRRITG
jgi:anti-sigma regulatory factor (Ser/Thr protein kinase)